MKTAKLVTAVLSRPGAENAATRQWGFLFGHYDSRGGATLVVAPRLDVACHEYAALFGLTLDKESEGYAHCDPVGDDYNGRYPVLFYGRVPFPGELLADYQTAEDVGFDAFWLVRTFDWSGQTSERRVALVFVWRNTAQPTPEQAGVDAFFRHEVEAAVPGTGPYSFRLEEATLGEDAWGCTLQYA